MPRGTKCVYCQWHFYCKRAMYFVRKTLGGEATLSNVLVMITLDVFILIVLLWMIYNATSIHMFHMYNVL